jgi:hypothetical protein
MGMMGLSREVRSEKREMRGEKGEMRGGSLEARNVKLNILEEKNSRGKKPE